jgi:DNA-binding transcriptional ArsR family regulator
MNAGALSESLRRSQTSISHHLGLLRQGGLISARREGNRKVYALTEAGEKVAKTVRRLID